MPLNAGGRNQRFTTVLVPVEAQVKQLSGVPAGYTIAAHLTIGWPAGAAPTRLHRRPMEEFATVDSFAGPPLREDR